MPQVLTANRLHDGEVVYLASDGAWVEDFKLARVHATAAEGAVSLAIGVEAEKRREVVHAYLFDVVADGTNMKPVKMREVIRSHGPTVRRDLGKQANS